MKKIKPPNLVPIYPTYCEFSCKKNSEVFILMPYGQNRKVPLKCFETLSKFKLGIFHHIEERLERFLGNFQFRKEMFNHDENVCSRRSRVFWYILANDTPVYFNISYLESLIKLFSVLLYPIICSSLIECQGSLPCFAFQ